MMGQEIEQNGFLVRGSEDLTNISGLNWADLQVYYKFNETSGTNPSDASSNSYNGTGVNLTTGDWETSTVPYIWDGSSSGDWGTLANWQDRGRGTVPASGNDILVDTGTSNSISISDSRTVRNIVITNGASLDLQSSANLTATGTTEVSGAESLVLHSDETETANFIDNGIAYRNSGTAKVERFLKANNDGVYLQGYHYISTPVNNPTIFSDMTDLYYYDEASLSWIHHTNFTNFTNSVGYAIRYTADITKEFIGELNTGNQSVAVVYNDNVSSSFDHFNLVGNPYPSSISADDVVDNNNTVINPTVYFWNGIDYSTYNTSLDAGTAGSHGATPDGQIAIGQAFYIDAQSGGGTLNFTNSMRGTDSNIFFKKENYPYARVALRGENTKSEVLLTGHRASSFEDDAYDTKHVPGYGKLSLTALLNGLSYDIQSVPEIEGHTFDLQIDAAIAQEIQFDLINAEGLNGKQVYIEDKEEGKIVNIREEMYNTYVTSGTHSDRFKLRITSEKSATTMWIHNGQIRLFSDEEIPTSARLIALDGKTVASTTDMQFHNWNRITAGVYLLEVTTNKTKHIQKIIK
jgi:hypothetical protein